MQERPNVIVLVSDTFRPDHLGISGGGHARTPELDAFVRRGITFDRARSSSFPTIPMREDWFTGRFSHPRHGWQDLDRAAITLPGILGAHGYASQLIASTTHMLRARFWAPFTAFHFLRGHEVDVPFTRLNDPVRPVVSDRRKTRVDFRTPAGAPVTCDVHAHTNFRQRYEDESRPALIADAACRWIEDNYRGGPFLLWLDSFDVHEPWFPPDYLLRSYQPSYDGEPMAQPNYHSADAYRPEELADLRARYASMCTLLSKHVGRILRLVEETGLFENTIVVLLSDHGTYLGEHGMVGKSLIRSDAFDVVPFHPEVARILWTMAVPETLRGSPVPAGTRMGQLVQAADLLPTVLDFCGIPAPAPARIEGTSLAPILRGETDASPREIAVTASSSFTHHGQGFLHCRRPTVTDGTWTLVLRDPPEPGPPSLYLTAEDPAHERDVIAEHRDEGQRLHRMMLDFLHAHEAPAAALERLSAVNVGLA